MLPSTEFFAQLQPEHVLRAMRGVYQHCAHNHLHRYLADFDFRYNNRAAHGIEDAQRADLLLKGVVGKRLTYETTAHQ
jgi:hypothetical protein